MPNQQDDLSRAFNLAYFIHLDKIVARDIAKRALAKLEVAANAQFKRYYYTPTGRSQKNSSRGHRTKVTLKESHLLQRLVYIESEAVEQQQEKNNTGALSRTDMVIRYVKHLVKMTLRRNSFYITLGVSRLLHNYSTSDTMELYALVIQDPERVPDDFYYRSRKKRLLQEFCTRFGDLLKVVRGYRGEQRFEEEPAPKNARSMDKIVRESLRRFTPWDSSCVVSDRFDPYSQVISELTFDGRDPDAEHAIEINRIHTVLHPDCYGRLTSSLELSKPEERLALPHFNLHSDEDEEGPEDDNRDPPDLSDEDRENVRAYLTGKKAARRQKVPAVLSVRVDGCECATLDPARQREVRLKASDDAELIEIYAPGEALLALYLVTDPDPLEARGPIRETIRLEAGQEVSFSIESLPDPDGLGATLEIAVGYRETQWVRSLTLLSSRIKRSVFAALGLGEGSRVPVWAPVLALLIIALLVFRGGLPFDPGKNGPDDLTRGLNFFTYGLPLSRVEAIYVDPIGEREYENRLREALIANLKASRRFRLPEKRDDADAVFKNLSEYLDGPKDTIVLALVNAEGETLWTVSGLKENDKVNPDDQARVILENLLSEINKE